MAKNKNIGSSFDEFLVDEGILEECTEVAIKRVLAWQIENEMKNKNLSKTAMANRMNTSRAALDRLLNPSNVSVTLHTMQKAAQALGQKLVLKLEPMN